MGLFASFKMDQTTLQPFLDVTIRVLDTRDASAAAKLKDFLMSSPGPAYTEQSLGLAVVYFAENKPPVFDWIMSNQEMLSPELELKSFTRKIVQQRLEAIGWAEGEDFVVNSESIVVASEGLMAKLDSYFSKGELTLIKASLRIDARV